MTAADLAQPTPHIASSANEPDVLSAFRHQARQVMPVVDSNSGSLLGAIEEPGG
jgi:hypothetical protein